MRLAKKMPRFDKLFLNFSSQLSKSLSDFEEVPAAEQELRYSISLQADKLKKKGLSINNKISPRGFSKDKITYLGKYTDGQYSHELCYNTLQMEKSINKDGKTIFHNKDNFLMYQTITDLANGSNFTDEDYCCPNCGAISKISQLVNGCSYCDTKFEMSELFPKVSNFFYVKDFSMEEGEGKKKIILTMIPTIIVLYLIVLLKVLIEGEPEFTLSFAIITFFVSIIYGIFLGGFVFVILTMRKLFKEAKKVSGNLIRSAGSNKRFQRTMQKYSPDFSYDYFFGKVVSIVRILMFSDDIKNLPYYVGQPLGDMFDNVIDATLYGYVVVKRMKKIDKNMLVTADVYMDDTYEKDGKVKVVSEVFRVNMVKDLSMPFNYNFSIKKIQCPNCAGSFDATRYKTCPYCNTEYSKAEDDWVITSIKKIK